MDKKIATEICYWLNEDGFDTEVITYSGRYMNGDLTTAVTGDFNMGDVIMSIINSADEFVDDDGCPLFNIDSIKQDSMGLGMVIY